ncbi:TonB-dependent receptor [Sorangium sp. So ce375]|uniref:TonB-dependent receptor domain-containing protein n=1 Tax=Sorangium sp. So ce375 TaxID=3133306 RepID=UPI003F5B93E0
MAAAALASTTALLLPVAARADGAADEADLHFEIGNEAYEKGDYRAALEQFLQSNRLVPNHNVVLNIALTYEKLQRYAEAYRYFVDALDGETNPQTIATIQTIIQRIGTKVAVLRVESSPPGATIYLERKDLGSRGQAPRSLAMAEGKTTVIVELPGHEPVTLDDVTAKLGSETRVQLVLKPIVGSVDVAIEGAPRAAVHVDDERAPPVCVAPCTFAIAPGPHVLFFHRDGYQAPQQQILVMARETVRAIATMTPLTGTVVVQASERDAVVEIDGKALGFTPTVVQNIPVGWRLVKVTLRGYAPIARVIEVKANQQTQLLDLRLVPLRQVAAASRFTENIDDAPSSVTVIDGQELRAFGYPTLWEALRGIRGVALSNDRTYLSASIRGIGEPNDYGNRMLVLQDGAILNDNLLNSTYIGTDGRPDLQDIDRIEVVRGPGSLLYGANAMSGVINMVPRTKDQPSSVHASVGTYENAVIRGRAGFHVNFTPKSGLWASASASTSDGFDSPVYQRDSPGVASVANGVDFHRARGTAGRLWSGPLTAQWYYNQNMHRVPIGAYGTIFNDARTFLFDERFLGEVRVEPKLTRSLQLLLRAHLNHYNYDGEYAFKSGLSTDSLQGTWFGAEGRLSWIPVDGLRVTGGAEVQEHPVASIFGYEEDGTTYVDEDHPSRMFAPYMIADWGAASWLRLSAGVRYNRFDYDGPSKDTGTPIFRGAVIVKAAKATTLKLMGGNSFRTPSIYEQFYHDGPGGAQVKATDPEKGFFLVPEHIYTGEIELSQRFLDDWSVLGSSWISRVEDIINTITVDPQTGAPSTAPEVPQRYVNRSEPALIVGTDVEVRREWRQGWFLSAHYSYQRARYFPAGDELALQRNPRLVNVPEHFAAARGVVPVLQEVASLGVRINFEAPRRIALSGDEVTRESVTADVTLSGGTRRFGLSYVLGLYNVADQRYDYINAASYRSRLTRQNGRTVLFDLTFQHP